MLLNTLVALPSITTCPSLAIRLYCTPYKYINTVGRTKKQGAKHSDTRIAMALLRPMYISQFSSRRNEYYRYIRTRMLRCLYTMHEYELVPSLSLSTLSCNYKHFLIRRFSRSHFSTHRQSSHSYSPFRSLSLLLTFSISSSSLCFDGESSYNI
jgi:hypothetical protein